MTNFDFERTFSTSGRNVPSVSLMILLVAISGTDPEALVRPLPQLFPCRLIETADNAVELSKIAVASSPSWSSAATSTRVE